MIAFMGRKRVEGKLEPNTTIRGHLGAMIYHHCPCFEWSKLARWTWQNSQSADWNFDWVPSYIEFASKKLKSKDNYEAWCWLFMEALACSTNHPGVMPSMQKPWRHTNCGGIEARLKRCWSTTMAKIDPLTIGSFCKGEGWILSFINVLWHLDKHGWNWLGHFCASWM